ncbi:TPA: hypothetical protein ACGU7P_003026 [Vibrio vulnificus]|uniref:hypothetical protein n=1 Tax=Vibrio vulnificus TaxID=672 RepID=UPI001A34F4BC|nr:hypothetical protein [Vibrio vulnificus]
MDPRIHGNDSWGRGGGALSFLFFAAELSSAFSFLIFVILADAGTHRIASAVARFSHFIVGVAVGADQFSHTVILANAGIHRIASTVARFWHFITRVAIGFAFVVVCCGEHVSKRGFWHVWMNGSPHARE